MEPIVDFKILPERLRQAAQVVTVAVASPADSHTEEVIERSIAEQFARFILVANAAKADIARRLAADYPDKVTLIVADDDDDAARHAVKEVREGRADVLMKGSLNTDNLLRAVLNKEWGILPKGRVLTHIAVAQIPAYHKLLFFTDAAVIPYPTHEQRVAQVAYLADMLHAFGIQRPRISLIHCAETVNDKFPHTLGYGEICERAAKGEWGELVVDGPLDLRTSCDPVGLQLKGIQSPLEGDADAVVVPDIEVGNVLYKSLPLFAGAQMAGTLQGTLAPVVLPSRGDDLEAKFHSLALATMGC